MSDDLILKTETLPRAILKLSQKDPDRPALRFKAQGHYLDIPWKLMVHEIRRYAAALLAKGIEQGDRVAIMAPNCPRWVYADLGIMAAGGVTVPVYQTEGMENILHILRDSGSRFLFLYSSLVAQDLAQHLGELPDLEMVILLEGRGENPAFIEIESFLNHARESHSREVDKSLEKVQGSDIATLVYTSGTTGPPKGVILTHDNILASIRAAVTAFDIGPGDVCLSFLPLSHVFERVDGYYLMLFQRAVIAYAESIDTVPLNLTEVRPTVVIGVPRLFEKMFSRIMEQVLSGSWLKKQVFFGALRIGRAHAQAVQREEPQGALFQGALSLAKKAVFERLRERLGGRVRFFISGGAPLMTKVAEFFLAAGIPIYEGYGLTESASGIAVNTVENLRIGSVGKALPETSIRIAEDGEILLSGPTIFQGYWNSPEQTEEVLQDGWFRTGDIGELDENGFLTITDRKKDLIVTAGGKKVPPQNLENLFKSDPLLSNALVYGDGKPYLIALLVPNFEKLEKFARQNRIDFLNHCDLVNHPRVLELVRQHVDTLQRDLPSFSRIKRFVLISRDFSGEGNEVTPTLKLKRQVIARNFNRVLEGMYLAEDHGIHDSGFCILEDSEEEQQSKCA
ncbi:MAG: long-chain fatty acid--CoA ligase [Syntrophotaleaceae bacterium]